MKWLKVTGLGIAIWGLSLLWPEVNRVLTPSLTIGLALGLGVGMLIYILSQQNHHGAGQNHLTDPVPVVLMR